MPPAIPKGESDSMKELQTLFLFYSKIDYTADFLLECKKLNL